MADPEELREPDVFCEEVTLVGAEADTSTAGDLL